MQNQVRIKMAASTSLYEERWLSFHLRRRSEKHEKEIKIKNLNHSEEDNCPCEVR